MPVSCNSEQKSRKLHRTHTLTMRASFTNTQMQADTLTGTNTQQVVTGWSPHSQNTDMQIGNLQTERRRWDKDGECTYRTGMGKKSQQMEE